MRRAINAAAKAIAAHRGADRGNAAELAEAAVVAAYPHLYQALTKETRELRARLADQAEQ
jgi:hypothetical protein